MLPIDNHNFIEITPENKCSSIDYRIFKNIATYQSYLFVNEQIFELPNAFGGIGIVNVTDYSKNGEDYLLYSVLIGSGTLSCNIIFFNLATLEERVIFSYRCNDFSALAVIGNSPIKEIYKFSLRDMNLNIPFEKQSIGLTKYAGISFESNIPFVQVYY